MDLRSVGAGSFKIDRSMAKLSPNLTRAQNACTPACCCRPSLPGKNSVGLSSLGVHLCTSVNTLRALEVGHKLDWFFSELD